MAILLNSIPFLDLFSGTIILLALITISILVYLCGKNYLSKRNAYYDDLYKKVVKKPVEKNRKKED
ncbi:hypothetical protein ADN00_13085 [Ornatilinea apprima]|uniref:Uncharacterized protein n=1 Tax=Ornatilinea apprima TaxID=1134406 RepID=A0A0P6XIG9_9CHLR|nr:hypothetical protein ADN00_13085 [Ornatilinea apprima]